MQLEPQRKVFASSFRGEPLECVGGVLNDLAADSRGGVYLTITGGGLFYANPKGVVSQYGEGVAGANGIILSPDEKTLYVTNGAVVIAFDVQADGSLTNQREFGKLRGGQGGDGSAVDPEGRVYVATGASVDVFAPNGEFLGTIPGPQGLHGTAFGGPRQEDALRHRLLRRLGHAEREKPGHRDPDDRAGLYRPSEVGAPHAHRNLHHLHLDCFRVRPTIAARPSGAWAGRGSFRAAHVGRNDGRAARTDRARARRPAR